MTTPAEHLPFDDRAGFSAAVLRVLQSARKHIEIVDRDLQAWPLETLDGDTVLRAALRQGAKLRVLVGLTAWLERNGTRFMRLQRDFSDRVECRSFPASLRIQESAIVVDGRHLVRRAHDDTFDGLCVLDGPLTAKPVRERFDAAWDESEPCLPPTTLGL